MLMKCVFIIFCLLMLSNSYAQSTYFPPNTENTWDTITTANLGWRPTKTDSLSNYLEQKKIIIDCKLFPNPATNYISFSGFPTLGVTHFSILNLSGQIIMEDDTFNHSINISELTSGSYILQLQNEEQQASKQFVKN